MTIETRNNTRQLSDEARAVHAAVGRATIDRNREVGNEAMRAFQAEIAEVEPALRSRLPNPLTGEQRMLVNTAVAAYEVVFRTKSALLTAHSSKRVAELVGQFNPAAGTLLRALRTLGLTPKDATDSDAVPTIEQLQAEYAERHAREKANGEPQS